VAKKELDSKYIYFGIAIGVILLIGIFLALPDGKKRTPTPSERVMERFEIPGAFCGNGEPYVMFFSEGPKTNGENNRLVIWLPGGGSTTIDRDGELSTPINNVANLLNRIFPTGEYYLTETWMDVERDFIFLNHPDNDLYVDDANWAIIPYCTQDFHSGNRNEPTLYDFTDQKLLVNQLEQEINNKKATLEEIERIYPFLNIEGREVGGRFEIEKLEIEILHKGTKNVELSLDKLFSVLNNRGFDISKADILMSGSSAGGFGTWYNAWRIGDMLYPYPDARFTIVPQSGSPSILVWDETQQDLVVDEEQVLDMNHRLNWHNVLLPCEVSGGNYRGGDECKDTLDLIDHYNNRWPEMDFEILTVLNKEDFLAVRALNEEEPGFEERLLNLCQSVHRYGQYISLTDNAEPYLAWLYLRQGNSLKRVHGFRDASLVVDMISPDGQTGEGKTLLEYINLIAARQNKGAVQIEHVLGIVEDVNNYKTEVTSRPDHLPECNVPWPETLRP